MRKEIIVIRIRSKVSCEIHLNLTENRVWENHVKIHCEFYMN